MTTTTETNLDFTIPQRLFKKSDSGKLSIWEVEVQGSTIINRFGYEGMTITEAPDEVKVGKNIGTVKETTPEQQALLEAKSRYEKQIKHKGYIADRDKALAGIRGRTAPVPMLAEKFRDKSHKAQYPAAMQPKLDGMRCAAVFKDGETNLFSRTGSPVNTVPHINKAITEICRANGTTEIVFDGELYCTKTPGEETNIKFEQFLSMAKRDGLHPDHELVEYHIYDVIDDELPFKNRAGIIVITVPNDHKHLKIVESTIVSNHEEAVSYFEERLEEGFEGAMLRNINSKYSHRRTVDLLKLKPEEEAEFPIVGTKEGRGKMAGCAVFVCLLPNGETFDIKMKGKLENLKQYIDDESTWKGKKLTVTYQELTAYGKPRAATGKRVRDYE